MSSDVSPAGVTPTQWPELDAVEQRVLGVLIEKQKTTPDAYPLSLNASVTGCNQKSNRDPVMSLEDLEVEAALTGLKEKGLVIRVQGAGRVERWRHNAYDALQVDKVELAVLADLLVRGAQTEGELRAHVSRMEPVEDLDTLRSILSKLAERKLVVYLTPPGHRGTKLTHGFFGAGELDALKRSAGAEAGAAPVRATAGGAPVSGGKLADMEQALGQAQAEIGALRSQLAEMQTALTTLQQELSQLKQSLGA
jgi:uncharacterized protein YceH (UPF0502 family)